MMVSPKVPLSPLASSSSPLLAEPDNMMWADYMGSLLCGVGEGKSMGTPPFLIE